MGPEVNDFGLWDLQAEIPFSVSDGPTGIFVDTNLVTEFKWGKDVDIPAGMSVIEGAAAARGYAVEVGYFDLFTTAWVNEGDPTLFVRLEDKGDLAVVIAGTDTVVNEGKGGGRFFRIIILCHGSSVAGIVDGNWVYRGPNLTAQLDKLNGVIVAAPTILSKVGPFVEPGGYLYVVACRQWTYHWQFQADLQNLNVNVRAVPGEGYCGFLDPDTEGAEWWGRIADDIFAR